MWSCQLWDWIQKQNVHWQTKEQQCSWATALACVWFSDVERPKLWENSKRKFKSRKDPSVESRRTGTTGMSLKTRLTKHDDCMELFVIAPMTTLEITFDDACNSILYLSNTKYLWHGTYSAICKGSCWWWPGLHGQFKAVLLLLRRHSDPFLFLRAEWLSV
jgi:hypothetical protein